MCRPAVPVGGNLRPLVVALTERKAAAL